MTGRRFRRIAENGYMLAVSFFLLWNIPYMTEAAWSFAWRTYFPAIWVGLTVLALLLQRLKPGQGGWLLALLAWMTAVSVYRGRDVLTAQEMHLYRGLLAFAVILPAPRIVRQERLLRWLRGILALWTAFLTAQAAVGLWAALTGHAVFSLKGTWYIGVNLGDNRLYLNAYVTTGAVKMGLSVLLAAVGLLISQKHTSKIVYAGCMLLQLVCLSLTDCRTAFIAVGAGMGLMLAAGLAQKSRPGPLRRTWLRRAVALAVIPVMAVAAYAALSGLVTALGPHVPRTLDNLTLMELPAHLLPRAAAEQAVQHRPLTAGNLFNDRQLIWTAAFRLLRAEPRFLLVGTTTALAPMLTNLYLPEGGMAFDHVHSIYLQALVSWGLPGLLLLAAFLLAFLRAAWRVTAKWRLPLWQRMTPVPALYVMLCETVDCFTRLSEESPMLLFGCLFAGMTLALDAQARRDAMAEKQAEAPVDVMIPVYNAEPYLARAVQSAFAAGATRVILVDDGSTDGSGDLCDQLAREDRRIVVQHQENRGASAARNAGLDAAGAELVAFLDADDVLVPGALMTLQRQMGDAEAIQGEIVRKTPENIPCIKTETLPGPTALRCALGDPTRHLLCHGWLFRRAALTQRFDEALTMGEDGEWLMRAMQEMKRAAYSNIPAYVYTVRADSALHGGAGVTEAYLRMLEVAAPTLEKLQMPQEAACYRLTHLLLILTHDAKAPMAALRESSPFAEAFAQMRFRRPSLRAGTLLLLKWRLYPLVRGAVGIRRRMNRCMQRKRPKSTSKQCS